MVIYYKSNKYKIKYMISGKWKVWNMLSIIIFTIWGNLHMWDLHMWENQFTAESTLSD